MIILTVNRDAGYNFIRWIHYKYHHDVDHSSVPGENKVELRLQPREVNLFREVLIRHPDRFENATVILKGLGHA